MYLPTRVEYLSMNINDPEGISVICASIPLLRSMNVNDPKGLI